MSTHQPDLDAVIFEFICACEREPWPGQEWPRFVPTAELLEEWASRFPQYRHELIEFATDLIIMDIGSEDYTPPTDEEVDAMVAKSMEVIRPMIDESFAEKTQGR